MPLQSRIGFAAIIVSPL